MNRLVLLAAVAVLAITTAACGTSGPDVEAIMGADASATPDYLVIDRRPSQGGEFGHESATLVIPNVTVQGAKDALAAWLATSDAPVRSADVVRSSQASVIVCRIKVARSESTAQIVMGQDELIRWSCPDPAGS